MRVEKRTGGEEGWGAGRLGGGRASEMREGGARGSGRGRRVREGGGRGVEVEAKEGECMARKRTGEGGEGEGTGKEGGGGARERGGAKRGREGERGMWKIRTGRTGHDDGRREKEGEEKRDEGPLPSPPRFFLPPFLPPSFPLSSCPSALRIPASAFPPSFRPFTSLHSPPSSSASPCSLPHSPPPLLRPPLFLRCPRSLSSMFSRPSLPASLAPSSSSHPLSTHFRILLISCCCFSSPLYHPPSPSPSVPQRAPQ